MEEIKERLDRLKRKIQTEDFLLGRGLSNEVNFWIFCYEPAEEMIIEHFVDSLVVDHNIECSIHSYNLYKVFLDICNSKNILSKIPTMEEKKGKDYLLRQIHSIAVCRATISGCYEQNPVERDFGAWRSLRYRIEMVQVS